MRSLSVKNPQSKPDGTYDYITVGTWNPLSPFMLIGDIEWNGTNSNKWAIPESYCSKPCNIGSYRVHVRDQADCCLACEE